MWVWQIVALCSEKISRLCELGVASMWAAAARPARHVPDLPTDANCSNYCLLCPKQSQTERGPPGNSLTDTVKCSLALLAANISWRRTSRCQMVYRMLCVLLQVSK